jgi:hypothetical protein
MMSESKRSTPPVSSSSNTTSGQEGLTLPDAPEPLDQEDYPDVSFWWESDWTAHCERQKDHGKTPPKLGFLTDDKGAPITESRIKKFMSYAKVAWNELYRQRRDPNSWTKKTPTAASYFMLNMKRNFPEFCYCEGDWKAERFAIIKYPDWCRNTRDTGHLTRASQFFYLWIALILVIFCCSRTSAFKAQERRQLEGYSKAETSKDQARIATWHTGHRPG